MGLVVATSAALAACGGGGGGRPGSLFATDWEDDGGGSIAAVRQRLASQKPKPNADIAVGVIGADKVVGLPLGGSKWTFQHALDVRPTIAGGVVLASGGGETAGLDAATGKKLWARPTGAMTLRGAGDDGAITVMSFGQTAGGGSVLLAVDRSGSVVRQVETQKSVGIPAVLGGVALVPWAGQYLTALDLSSGDEIGRALLREKASRAWTSNGGVWFGEVGIFRFDDTIKLASKSGTTHLAVPSREFPGNPTMLSSGEDVVRPAALATDKVRLWARPASADGPIAYDSNRFYATYFRIVMGFEVDKKALAWVVNRPNDVIGAAAGGGSIVVCDESGAVLTLDAQTGGTIAEQTFGEPIKSCVVQVDGWRAPGAPKAMPPLAEQISTALLNRDSEMATGQRMLLREMSALEDETATKTLVELASDPRTVPVLVDDARIAIASRKNGTPHMLAALERHYDFLKDVLRAPPVGPIAQALGNMKEKKGAPALASHLLDPASTDDDVKRAAAALVGLADPAQLPELKQFLAMYRGTAENEEIASAVGSVAEAILNAGGADGRKLVDATIADPMTQPAIKARLASIVQAADVTRENKPKDDPKKPPPPKK
jgi:outer membrane protein assembly factor BamB